MASLALPSPSVLSSCGSKLVTPVTEGGVAGGAWVVVVGAAWVVVGAGPELDVGGGDRDGPAR